MLIPSTAGAKNPTATINCHMAPADYFQKSVLVKCDICQAESQQRQSFRILAAPEYLICSIALVTTLRTRLVKDKHPQVNRTTPLKYKLVNTIVHKDEAQQGYWITGVIGAEKQVYSINDRQVTAMTNAFLRQNLQWELSMLLLLFITVWKRQGRGMGSVKLLKTTGSFMSVSHSLRS
jgi:hypothetical protein